MHPRHPAHPATPAARRPPRTDERGAALFIVVMVTMLLGAIGIFAVRASSQLEAASGFSRLWTQSAYVAETALRVVAADMAGKEDDYEARIASGTNNCRANAGQALPTDAVLTCFSIDQLEMQRRVAQYQTDFMTEKIFQNVGRPGVTGGPEGAFRVELTEIGPAPNPQAGMDLKGGSFDRKQVTVTATGHVRPSGAPACDAATAQASGMQAVRSHITFMSSR